MKFTVLGFSQTRLVQLGLDLNDALILRWFVDFYATNRMIKVQHEGKEYVQVRYKAILEDIPIIGIKSKDVLRRRWNKMVDAGLIESYTHKAGGTFSFYRLVEDIYESLITSDSNKGGTTQKSEGYDSKVGGGTTQKSEQNNPSTSNPSTKSNTPCKSPKGTAVDHADFLKRFNEASGRQMRVVDAKARRQLRARLKDGFTIDEIIDATKKCAASEHHRNNGGKYLTPEFITRADKLQMYLHDDGEYKSDF